MSHAEGPYPRHPRAWRHFGWLAVVASLLVVNPITSKPVVGTLKAAAPGAAGAEDSTRLLLLSFAAAERATYEGVYEVELRAPRLHYAASFHIVHDPADPSRSVHELVGPIRIDGRPVDEDDPNVEVIERKRSFATTQGLEQGSVGGPMTSGSQSLAYPILFELRRFSIADSALFRENYEVREVDVESRVGSDRRVLSVEPLDASLPHYRVELDSRTALLLSCEKTFPDRPAISIRHSFLEVDIAPGSPPVLASEAPPEFRLPTRRRFALSEADAAAIVPGFRYPDSTEVPAGFQLAGIEHRQVEPGSRAIQVELSNGLERFFVLARPAAFRREDPVAAALPRLSAELDLDGLPAAAREAVLEVHRPFLESAFEQIADYESSARGSRRDAHVAWRRTQMGVTKFTIYGERFDFLIVGSVTDGRMLRSVEYLLAR